MPEVFADKLAATLTDALRSAQHRIVFVESCTAGLVSASMARIPGVSEVLTGSAVTYQVPTKTAWAGVRKDTIQEFDVVSEAVSREMATGGLSMTPHASVAVSVTGHLGPDAPDQLDGVAWSCVAIRTNDDVNCQTRKLLLCRSDADGLTLRRLRQIDAARQVLQFSIDCLTNGRMPAAS